MVKVSSGFFWCYGLLWVYFPCIMSICGSYMASDWLILSIVIGKFLIFLIGLFKRLCWCTSYNLLWYSCCVRSFDFSFEELCFVTFYCVQKLIIGNLVVIIVIFNICSFIIIESLNELVELNYSAIINIHIDWVVNLCVKCGAGSTTLS